MGPSPDYPTCGPFCDSSAALAATVTGEGQLSTSESPDMMPLDSDSPWLAPTSMESDELRVELIADGTHTELYRIAGNVEGTQMTRSHNLNKTANTNDLPMDTHDKIDQDLTDEYSPSHDDSPDVHAEANSWEAENLAIRKRRFLKSGKFTRSNLTIGSLNIAGRDGNMSMHSRNHKFKFLKQTIDENHLGVLETQLEPQSTTQFNNVFGRWFKLYYSAHPDKPSSTVGVAFVLNKKILDTENIREYELIPGRALMIVVPWHKGESLTI